MKILVSIIIIVCLVVSLIVISLPSFSTPKYKADPIKHTMSLRKADIDKIIGLASCTAAHQCHTIGFGDKPCGGFSSYLVYSDHNTDIDKLEKLVAEYNKLSVTWNRENNISSTCDVVVPPPVTCLHQVCQPQEESF